MNLETFRNLIPDFKHTGLIFLQGWGEPLMNPEFFEMARLAKEAGCEVGTTTNGTLVDEGAVAKMIDSGIDIIAFSVAGASINNDVLRKGTSFKDILNRIDLINGYKEKLKKAKPKVNIAYLLLRGFEQELPGILHQFKDKGINEIVITTLDFIASEDMLELSVNQATKEELGILLDLLDNIVKSGRQKGLSIYYQVPNSVRNAIWCSENVNRAMFISASGDVSPCVFTNLPVESATRYTNHYRREAGNLVFGNINDRSLTTIWRTKEYRRFRNSFFNKTPSPVCEDCPKLGMIN